MAARWTGDLHRLAVRAWREEGNVAALIVVRGEDAHGWINLSHVEPGPHGRMVWLWMRHAAHFRPPLDVLYADDLDALVKIGDDQQSMEA